MSSPSAVACREVFDENSQPSAEEISEYAQQLGIDPESESHLLPLAKDGLMQALPAPWKAFFDEKLQSHYYYNEETKRTQWEHPLDNVYRELVKKARDASMQDDTCASVQELLTSEENTKNLERVETKVESDDELSTDSENHPSDAKETALAPRRLAPLGRPPLAPLTRIDKKLGELRISPLRRSVDSPLPPRPALTRNASDKDVPNRPKTLFKQQSEIIDLKMHILNSPEDENFSSLLASAKVEKGLPLTGKGSMFLKLMKSELPSPETEKSLPLDSLTKSDPPKGILREKLSDTFHRKTESLFVGKPKHTNSLDEDRKSVRFKLETLPDPTISPGSNSSSEQNEGQSSIISATPVLAIPSPLIPSSPVIPSSPIIPSSPATPVPSIPSVLSPLTSRPPLPPRPQSTESLREKNSSDKDSIDSDSRERPFDASPRRRVLRPPAADYIKPDLFQKNFQKISDLVRPGDIESAPVNLDEPKQDKDVRPRSPMIPLLKNKISINLMESIESETSIDSPDKEFANLDLNDLDDSNENKDLIHDADNKIEYDNKHAEDNSEKASVHSKISLSLKCSSNVSKDFDDSSEKLSTHSKTSVSLKSPNNIPKDLDDNSDKAAAVHSKVTSYKSQHNIPQIPQLRVPKLELLKKVTSDPEESRKNTIDESKSNSKSDSVDIAKDNIPTPQLKVSPTPSSSSELRSPRADFGRPWSTLSTFKPPNRAIIAPLKSSDSANSLPKGLTSPRLDGVILSQGKSSSDNVVVVYQFETQDENFPKPKSPLIPDMGTRDMIERQKGDERRRLELTLQKELESIRIEWSAREKRMRSELQEELREAEQKFLLEKRVRLEEQAERHQREMEDALKSNEHKHIEQMKASQQEFEDRYNRDCEEASKQFAEKMSTLLKDYKARLLEQQEQLEIENERALSDLSEQLQASLHRERTKMIEENRTTIEVLREEHNARVTDLRHDYRAEVEHLRSQHACHLEELRARLAGERAAGRLHDDRALADKYRCLKEKYARLKHDVKMSIERRNKRREMSMTTGSETEKSNSHKATQSLERCKELNETSVSAVIETEPTKLRTNNNPTIKYNDNETSFSESNAHKSYDNNNEHWKCKKEGGQLLETNATKPRRRTAVAFREPPRRRRDNDRDAATTDCQDSSDATTADEKPKEAVNGHGRRRCFTRLKSASTSRLNYSPKRGEGWSSPLESLRQQLRKLDDLEEQFPDLACQPSYTLRYPFAELGVVRRADSAELEFVRHRAVVEREGMRRARDVLRRRRAALRENRAALQPHIEPSEEREATELEVALHRARALLGEKEIRLRHIERALRRLPEDHEPLPVQEGATDSASSCSSAERVEAAAGGAVLRSLRALHADVRDIWRALDLKRAHTASPETSSCNAPSTSQTRMTLSAPEPVQQDNSDGSVNEKARGLRAWLQT